ncbi:MAG: 30S ribosomal protein S6 [Thermodesulfobacteriota bacterium]
MQERHYETVCIINPDVGEEAAKEIVKKISGVIEKQKGVALIVTDWGRKRMTYPIAKKTSGHYVLFAYDMPPDTDKEVELALRYHEGIIRYQTVRVEKRPLKKVTEVKAAPQAKVEEAKAPQPEGGANG